MTRLIRAELLKQRTTRSSTLTLASMVGLILLLILLHGFSLSGAHLSTATAQLKVVGWGTSIGALFAALLGANSLTGEIRNGTIRPTFLATPKRERVILAKLAAAAMIGTAVGLLAEGLCAGIEAVALGTRGIHIELTTGDYLQLLGGGAAAGAFFAAIGLGVGAVVRHQIAAVIGLTLWLILIETTLIGNLPAVGKFAPGAAAGAISGAIQTQSKTALLAPGIGLLLLTLYALVAGTGGIAAINRRDVA